MGGAGSGRVKTKKGRRGYKQGQDGKTPETRPNEFKGEAQGTCDRSEGKHGCWGDQYVEKRGGMIASDKGEKVKSWGKKRG